MEIPDTMRCSTSVVLLLVAVALTPSVAVIAEERLWPTLKPGPHVVGFKTLDVTDYGRTVAPRVDWRGNEHLGDNFRHVRISLWYPAASGTDREPMVYRGYIEAAGFETHMDGELLTGLDAYLAHSTFGGADKEKLRQMVEKPTTARRDAKPLEGEPEKALGYFRQALAHNPDSGFAKRSIRELEAELTEQ